MAGRGPVRLTERQQECVALLWHGLHNKEIAARLGLSRVRVRDLLYAAYARLGLRHADDPRTLAALRLWRDCERLPGQTHEGSGR
jgi:DNA-binding CsgD family transcriptional regulator